MKSKYSHKLIIYNKKRIENNYNGLVEKLAEFDMEAIPKDFLENLNNYSKLFKTKRKEFYQKNSDKMHVIDEILPYYEETNIETNKVLAFIRKYSEFACLIVGIDYFNGEDEYIETLNTTSFRKESSDITLKILFGYYYGLRGNELNIFLKDENLTYLI